MTSNRNSRRRDRFNLSEFVSCYASEKRPVPSPMKQRPIQTIMRRKPVQKVDPPVKPELKGSSNDAKVVKAEVKKQEEEKNPAPPPAPVNPQSGRYELSSRMTQMVETELRDIMIKVWQELPDNPTDEAESLVVDKLRNKAGDDLRNVLGLNITKRLLNVHNPLYVKVQFSGKPEKVHLGEFLKKYNFNAFKRMEKTVNMFAAQVRTIGDFDRICSTKDIRCGDIKVTVNPIYKFTKCPPNLVTSFDDQDDEASEDIPEKSNKKDSEKVATKQIENVPPKVEASTTENVAKVEKVVTQPKVVNKPVENKNVSKPAVESKATVTKTAVENKPVVNKPAVETKTPANKPAAENKPTVTKPVNTSAVNKTAVNKPEIDKPVTKHAVENKAAVEKSATNKVAINKPTVDTKASVNKTSIETKEVKKTPINTKTNDTAKELALAPVKTPTKTEVKAASHTKDNVVKKRGVENDYDELDDYDILALMSDGIVLDECSGSDEE